MVAYFLQWGAALIVCAVLAQEVAKKVKGIHYPLLVAAAYVGNAFCLVGISGTIALNVAGGWNFEGCMEYNRYSFQGNGICTL